MTELSRRRLLLATGTVGATLVAVSPVSAQGRGEVGLSLQPAEETVGDGTATTVHVVVEAPDRGIAAFDLEIAASDQFRITGATLAKETLVDQVEYTDRSLSVEAAQGNNTYEPASEHVVATISLEALETGTATVAVETLTITDGNNDPYDIVGTEAATIDVAGEDDTEVSVAIGATNAPVTAGEELTVDVAVSGQTGSQQTIDLDAGSLGTESATVDLQSRDESVVTFSLSTEQAAAGPYDVVVTTPDASARTTVEVVASDDDESTGSDDGSSETGDTDGGDGSDETDSEEGERDDGSTDESEAENDADDSENTDDGSADESAEEEDNSAGASGDEGAEDDSDGDGGTEGDDDGGGEAESSIDPDDATERGDSADVSGEDGAQSSDNSGNNNETGADDGGPGFGVGSALAGIAGVGYLLRNRLGGRSS